MKQILVKGLEMERVTRDEAYKAGKASTLDALFMSLKKWLAVVSRDVSPGDEPCALCIRFSDNYCNKCQEKCPLKDNLSWTHACCSEFIRTVGKDGIDLQRASIPLCDKIMARIHDELVSIVDDKANKALEPKHRMGNKYRMAGATYILACNTPGYNHLCLINIYDGGRWSDGAHVKDVLNVTAEEWASIVGTAKGRVTLIE